MKTFLLLILAIPLLAQPTPTVARTNPHYVNADPGNCQEGETIYNLTTHLSKICNSSGQWQIQVNTDASGNTSLPGTVSIGGTVFAGPTSTGPTGNVAGATTPFSGNAISGVDSTYNALGNKDSAGLWHTTILPLNGGTSGQSVLYIDAYGTQHLGSTAAGPFNGIFLNNGTCVTEYYTSSGSITAYTLVVLNSDGTVSTASASASPVFGIAQLSVATAATVGVCVQGESGLIMDGTATAGDIVTPSAATQGYGTDSTQTSVGQIGYMSGVVGTPIVVGCTGVACQATVFFPGPYRAGPYAAPALPSIGSDTILGNNTGGTGAASALSVSQVQTLLSQGYSTSAPYWLRFFGDGNEGAITCTTTIVGAVHYVTNFTVSFGQSCSGFGNQSPIVIYATGTITIAGTLTNQSNNNTAACDIGGSGGGGGGGTTAGGAGITCVVNPNSPGTNDNGNVIGGTAGAPTGGNAGNGGNALNSKQAYLSVPAIWPTGGGSGGVGGSSGGVAVKGGGVIILVAPTINFTGTINVSGFAGNNATGNNTGPSGGGGGGVVITAAQTYTNNSGTINVAGGAAGSCLSYTGCGTGGTGGNGWSKQYTITNP